MSKPIVYVNVAGGIAEAWEVTGRDDEVGIIKIDWDEVNDLGGGEWARERLVEYWHLARKLRGTNADFIYEQMKDAIKGYQEGYRHDRRLTEMQQNAHEQELEDARRLLRAAGELT